MMSPQCYGGCSEREDADPFHYYYHVKSAECCWRDGEDSAADNHSKAALWLAENDLNGADPYDMAAKIYREGL
jgi:hypothetical protein